MDARSWLTPRIRRSKAVLEPRSAISCGGENIFLLTLFKKWKV